MASRLEFELKTRSRGSQQSLQRLPDETLQHIFCIACFAGDFNHDARSLHQICRVSRRWHAAATTCPTLWSTLPFINLLSLEDKAALVKANKQLDLYLPRSESHPLSFRCTVGALKDSSTPYPQTTKTFQRLVAQCARWEKVDLDLRSYDAYALLEPIRGRLPSLVSVIIDLHNCPHLRPTIYNVFSDAPRLRKVSWAMQAPTDVAQQQRMSLVLPFSQLQDFRVDNTSFDRDTYSGLMSDPSPQLLKTVSYMVREITSLPPTNPILLPHLEKLELVAESYNSVNLVGHLDCLTLPSLKHLEIRGRVAQGDLYLPVLNLLRRSGCSALDHLFFTCPSTLPSAADAFGEMVALCPDITTLGLDVANAAVFTQLIIDASASARAPSVLPKLKRLITHHNPRVNDYAQDLAYTALADAIRSRTVIARDSSPDAQATPTALPDSSRRPQQPSKHSLLEEVVFICQGRSALAWNLVAHTALDEFDWHGMAELPQDALDTLPWEVRYLTRVGPAWHGWKAHLNIKRHWRVHRLSREWEKLDFESWDTHKLVRHGYPTMLRRLLDKKPGETPGEHLFFYRLRAKRLLDKWRPHMLRDARKYLWAHYDNALLVLKFNITGVDDDNDELYRDLVGLERLNTPSDHAHLTKWAYPDEW